MALYIVSYDLKTPGRNYNNLYEAIKSYGTWWHHLESTWIIKSNLTAGSITDHLRSHLDTNDLLLVAKMYTSDTEYNGWLPAKAWEWIKNNR